MSGTAGGENEMPSSKNCLARALCVLALAAGMVALPRTGGTQTEDAPAGRLASPPTSPAQTAPPQTPSTPPWQAATPWPDRVIVTLEQDPRSSFSVSWRTAGSVTEARAEIVLAADHSRFDLGAESVTARTELPNVTHKTVDDEVHKLRWNDYVEQPAYHSVMFTGLAPDMLYAYRVMGAEGHWSEWFQTRTAPEGAEPFRFLYFGDAQDGILSHWARVVREAYATAPDARFAIHAGDLVNIGSRDYEWAEWFKSVGFIHGMIPALPAVGNHEYFDGLRNEDGDQITALSVLWRPQFALPQDPKLPDALQETVYAVRYGDALIAVLDTMADRYFDVQAEWLDATLAATDATWKIVTMHHPLFEMLERPYLETGPERRAKFLPVLERHGVDIVLQGHDHSYGRGATFSTPRRPSASRRGDLGTVFVTSSAGAKMYSIADDGWQAFAGHGADLQRAAENTPFFQVLSIDGDVLAYEARTASSLVYDAFRLVKPRSGPNRIEELPTDFPEQRRFDNTGSYESSRLDVQPPLPETR
jgi:3',5'-cyclic AMP phosphodiesterase CpdA